MSTATTGLYRTTIVIWTEYNPSQSELVALAHDATDGDAYCSVQASDFVEDPTTDPYWDGTEFFTDPFAEEEE